MQWFENRPLMGKRVVITRSREQAGDLVRLLTEFGADCIECPAIKVMPPDDFKALDAGIEHIAGYDWLIFTSVNGVDSFFDRLFNHHKLDVRALGDIKTAVIGPATRQRLLNFGIKSDILPESYRAESVVKAFKGQAVKGRKILLPRAREARPVIPVELTSMGAYVDEVTAYTTVEDRSAAELLVKNLRDGKVDIVTFTSSSTVKNFYAMLPKGEVNALMQGVLTACIGPITAETVKQTGLDVNIIAESFTIKGLSEAILQHYR
jgi:uroporphyrinogen III methyltransferase/synthase